MRVARCSLVLVLPLLGLILPGCRREGARVPATAAATAAALPAAALGLPDVRSYVAVRDRALQRLETALVAVEQGKGGLLSTVEDLSVAEREAARALGVDWQRYRWVKEEIARLLSAQRQREDAKLLGLELTRARDDLATQLKVARDEASRQFLEAQIASLDAQLARIENDRQTPEAEREVMALVDGVRAEIAMHQGRQERIQRQVRELLGRARAIAASTPAPA
ncbi:MAG: hypothetical protein V1750_10805, partial [Acidobacteriota bacterium]